MFDYRFVIYFYVYILKISFRFVFFKLLVFLLGWFGVYFLVIRKVYVIDIVKFFSKRKVEVGYGERFD